MATKKVCYIAEHDGRIYGAGSSRSAALKHAKEWTGGDTRGVTLTPATSALCRFVRKHGFDESRVAWTGRSKVGLKRKRRS